MNNAGLIEILLVEDNPNDVELTLRAFKKINLVNEVRVVTDGAQALDYIFCTGDHANRDSAQAPRVVILDLKLPKVSGKEVLKRIKSDARTSAIPVVVLTSSQEESDVVASYGFGVNSYIVKPVDFEKFVDTIVKLGMYWAVLNQVP